jgi:hypothetical protein
MGVNIEQILAKTRHKNGTGKDKLGTVDIHLSIYRQLMVNRDTPEMSRRVIVIAKSIMGINQKALCTFSEIKGSNIGRGVSAG